MHFKRFSIIVLTLLLFPMLLPGCSQSKGKDYEDNEKSNPVATLEIEDMGVIKIELYPKIAPNTVNNFIALINNGFYDGLIFHRVIGDFMIQGGCPEGTGYGNPGYSIKGEFDSNGHPNPLKHTKGVISMARSRGNDTAGSQFFIMVEDSPHLDGEYAAFGRVIEGMDVVNKIAVVETDRQDKPYEDVVIKKATVETFGIEHKEPEVIH